MDPLISEIVKLAKVQVSRGNNIRGAVRRTLSVIEKAVIEEMAKPEKTIVEIAAKAAGHGEAPAIIIEEPEEKKKENEPAADRDLSVKAKARRRTT